MRKVLFVLVLLGVVQPAQAGEISQEEFVDIFAQLIVIGGTCHRLQITDEVNVLGKQAGVTKADLNISWDKTNAHISSFETYLRENDLIMPDKVCRLGLELYGKYGTRAAGLLELVH